MHVTFRQLRVLAAVARHRSFTRASEELHLSQPAVSMQMKQLENVVGLPLFEQMGKQIHLTDAGEVMARYSRAIAEQLAEATQAIDDLKGVEGGTLRISVVSTVNYFASRLLAAFGRAHPGVRIVLDVTNREAVLRQLQENTTDLVLMGQPPRGLDVVAEPFMENPLVVVAPPAHPLAGVAHIPLTRLERETFLLREQGSGTRMAMERFFEEKGITPSSSAEMRSNEAIKQSVEAGLGLAVVSAHTVGLELDAGRLVILDVESFPIRRQWYLVHHSGKRLSLAAQAFREIALEEARSAGPRARPESRRAAPRRKRRAPARHSPAGG